VFTSLGGQARTHLAMLDYATGLATSWDPEPDGAVWSLAAAGNTAVLWRRLHEHRRAITGASRRDRARHRGAGRVGPAANATVRALTFQQGVLFVGGGFTTVAGQPRTGLAALDPARGAVLPLDAGLGLGHSVLSVASAAGHTFASGSQTSAGGEPTQALTVVAGPDPVLGSDGAGTRADRATCASSAAGAHGREREAQAAPRDGRRDRALRPHRPPARDPRALGHRPPARSPWRSRPAQLQPGIYLVRAITPEGDIAGKLVILP
jgi:hypothetical protein